MVDGSQETPRKLLSRRGFLKFSGAAGLLAVLEVFSGISGCTIRPPESGDGVYEVGVNSDNFQTVLMKLKEVSDEIPIRLSLSAGEYQMPQWQEMPVPTNKNWESTRESARVNFSISNKKKIEFVGNLQNPESTVININGEVGLHFSNCEHVGFQGITFRGGLPRTKGERGDASTSAIRSQILIENASSVTSNFCRHEGLAAPYGYIQEVEDIGINGLSIFNSAVEAVPNVQSKTTVASINRNIFSNVAGDGVCLIGAVQAHLLSNQFNRTDMKNDPLKSGICWNRGSAVAALNGARVKFTDSIVSGYLQPIYLNDVGGGEIKNVIVTAPAGIDPTIWGGKYLIGTQWPVTPTGEWVIHQHGRPIGNLSINGLHLFSGENLTPEQARSVPAYKELFTGIDWFSRVDMEDIHLAIHPFVNNPEGWNSLRKYFFFMEEHPETPFSVKNWTIAVIRHGSEVQQLFPLDLPEGRHIQMEQPKIIEVTVNG